MPTPALGIMTDEQIANLLGIANGYEIAYRLAELRSEVHIAATLRDKSDRVVELVISTAIEDHNEIFSDDSLREEYSKGLFSALNIQHRNPKAASQ